MAKEKEGIEALQYRERTRTKHSQIILDLLRLATEQFEKFKSPDEVSSDPSNGGGGDGRG